MFKDLTITKIAVAGSIITLGTTAGIIAYNSNKSKGTNGLMGLGSFFGSLTGTKKQKQKPKTKPKTKRKPKLERIIIK